MTFARALLACSLAFFPPAWAGTRSEPPIEAAIGTPPVPDAEALVGALKAGRFDELEATLAPFVQPADRAVERVTLSVWSVLSLGDPALTPRFEAWVAAHPASAAALIARSNHRESLGWFHRGNAYANRTDDQRMSRFAELILSARADAEAALALAPAAIEPFLNLVLSSMYLGEDCAPDYERARAAVPWSVQIRTVYAGCFEPRWGGDLPGFEAFVRAVEQERPDDPELRVLRAFPYAWAARDARDERDYPRALMLYKKALAIAPRSTFHAARARIYLNLESFDLALEESDAALAIIPVSAEYLGMRGRALVGLGRHDEAAAVIARAARIDQLDTEVERAQAALVAPAVQAGRARLEIQDAAGALRHFKEVVALAPRHADGHFLLGWTKSLLMDRKGAEQALRRAIALQPDDQRSYVALDRLLAPQGRWQEIAAAWDTYISYRPDDAEAYYERGGTRNNMGDKDGAVADMDKACALGRKMGCVFAVLGRIGL